MDGWNEYIVYIELCKEIYYHWKKEICYSKMKKYVIDYIFRFLNFIAIENFAMKTISFKNNC